MGSDGFWGSGEGIGMRLGMLSGSINTGSYNNALQVLAPAYGVQYFKMSGPQPKCEYCTGIMGASIGKACSCPSFLPTRFAHICGMCGFLLQNPSLQHSGILSSKLKVTGSNPSGSTKSNSTIFS